MSRRHRTTTTTKPVYFNSQTFGLCSAEFESGAPDTITKSALVMVEGQHVDSSKRTHNFDAQRIQRIVERTNDWMAKGGRVPWQMDHKKTQDANIGDLEGGLEVRVITSEDLPNPKLRHLIGKVGAFAQDLIGKGKDVVDDILAGRIKTLSPGIDINADIIREISATPTPAIVGLSTFKRHDAGKFALTMEEAEADGSQEDAMKEEFEELGETFWSVVGSIFAATEDELQGQEPQALMMQAIEDYSSRVIELLGVGDEAGEPYANNLEQIPPNTQTQLYNSSAPDQGYLQRQQGMSRMSRRHPVAAFTLADMQDLDRAEFFSIPGFGPPPRERKQRSLLGTVAKGAIAVGAGAAAIRYGGAGLKAGLAGARTATNMGAKMTGQGKGFGSVRGAVKRAGAMGGGVGKSAGLMGAQAGIGSAFRGVRTQLGTDIARAGKALASTGQAGGIRSTVGSYLTNSGRSVKGSTKARATKWRTGV